MTTYNWSTLTNLQVLSTFDANVDVLVFDDLSISAASVVPGFSNQGIAPTNLSFGGKTVALQIPFASLTTSNVTFANGSLFLVGDNTTGTANDNNPNTLTGGNGNDRIFGLGGDDSMTGGAGNDTFVLYTSSSFGNDTIDGGTGSDTLDYSSGTALSLTINLATHAATNAQGNTSLTSIETVFGTDANDSFTGGDAAHATDSFGNSITERFRGNGGADTITGGAGNNFFTVADYGNNSSVQAVNGTLGTTGTPLTGSVIDGRGFTDTITNVDAIFGGAGNDTLTGGSQSRSSTGFFQEVFRGNAGNDTINGLNANTDGSDANTDRADYANNTSSQAVAVSLSLSTALDGLGGTDTLIDIDQVYGGAGNDTLLGGVGNDVFDGGIGNDYIDGGAGSDEARFQQSSAAVIANLSASAITINSVTVAAGTANDGMGGTDTLFNIEYLRGSDFNDYFRGSDNVNVRERFRGDAGNDTFDGGAGVDIASYGNTPLTAGGLNAFLENGAGTVNDKVGGIDTLINIEGIAGTNSNDTLTGGLGDQWFSGGGGSDSIDGGAGNNWVTYAGGPSGVTVNLAGGTATDGWNGLTGKLALGGTDTLINIQNVEGSGYADNLTGDSGSNILIGGGDADTLIGGLGNDTLIGGVALGGLDDNRNDVADYSAAGGSVTVNLTTGTASGADGSDTLSGIEFVFGSNFDDTITGNEDQNFLRGRAGNDVMDGGGQSLAVAAGILHGDFADYSGNGSAVNVSLLLQGTQQNTIGAGLDTLTNFESLRGTSFDDALTGDGGSNFLRGGLGNDVLDGGVGTDWADYRNASAGVNVSLAIQGVGQNTISDGTDTLINMEGLSGSDFNDTLTGSSGNDFFRGRNGNDSIDGGAGFDIVTYRFAASGVTVSLFNTTGTASSGEGSDTLLNIEGVEGSMFTDVLTGNNSVGNALYGFGGGDTFGVTQGADTIDGGADFDSLFFTSTGVVYSGTTGITVNLTGATKIADWNNAAAGTDTTLISIEFATGTAGNDVFIGGDLAHDFDSTGNNTQEGFRPLGGNDTITGANTAFGNSAGVDYATNSSAQVVTSNFHLGTAQDGFGGTDTFVNVGTIRGGLGNDSLLGGGLARAQQGAFFETFRGNAGNDTINGNNSFSDGPDASSDRADYSNNNNLQAVNVNLGTGVALDGILVNGVQGTDTLIDIDQVTGGLGNDTLTGGSNNDVLDGGAGNDIIDGGAGSDEARFQQSTAGVIVNLSAAAITINGITVAAGTANDGMGGTDTLISIENVRGSDFNDYIRGSDDVNVRQFFTTDAGNDTVDGGAGVDLYGFNGALALGGANAFVQNGSGTVNDLVGGTDTLINIEGFNGTHANDTLTGGTGDQWLRGRGGSDTLDGGADNDWVTYSSDPTGVTINLATGTATDGWNGATGLLALGGTDTLISIENAEGSDYNDTITGNSGDNLFKGRLGNDTINGGLGIDTAIFNGTASLYTITRNGLTTTVSGPDGTDTLTGIEKLQFADLTQTLTRPGATDTNGDIKSDLLWRNDDGGLALWNMNGVQSAAADYLGIIPSSFTIVDGQGDYNGDGKSDLLWRNSDGGLAIWAMDGTHTLPAATDYLGIIPPSFTIVSGHGDYNGDGKSDILWRNTDGGLAIWSMDGTHTIANATGYLGIIPPSWSIICGSGDYNGDGKSDILWRNSDGNVAIWAMDGAQTLPSPSVTGALGIIPTNWSIVDGQGDYNGDGKSDLLWRNADGGLAIWNMNGTQAIAADYLGIIPPSWTIVDGHGDYNGDGKSDLLWRNSDGGLAIWAMDGTHTLAGATDYLGIIPTSFTILSGHGDFNGDGKSDILWRNSDGGLAIWAMDGTHTIANATGYLGIIPPAWHITTELGGGFSGDGTANTLTGTDGRDRFTGSGGSDTLTGGAGEDLFDYNATSDSTPAQKDVIADFKHGTDKIDLLDIDANLSAASDQAFLFGGNNSNTVANSVTWFESGGNTLLSIDNSGDTTADMQITLIGTGLGLTATDFML